MQETMEPEQKPHAPLASPAKRLGAHLVEAFLLGFPWALGEVGLILGLGMWAWELWCWSKSKTIGKQLTGMTVVDSRTREEVGWGMMFLREILGKTISGLVIMLGFAWILIDDEHQGWHDKLIGSVVVEDTG